MRKTRTLLLALSLGLSMSAYAAEPVFPTGKVVAFSADGGDNWEYHTQQEVDTPYVFEAQSGKTGMIVFNPDITRTISIVNDFQLKGANFEIKTTEGQTVSFTQPLSNQGTAVTLTGSGTVETHGAAAFADITVDNGATMKINSQIGVTDKFNINAGGTLELGSTAQLLLTDQIQSEGTLVLQPGAIVDASNLSKDASDRLGIQFEDLNGKILDETTGSPVESGFLYGASGVQTKIATGGTVKVIEPAVDSELKVAQLQVGFLSFDIEDNGIVKHTATDYSVWFQNGGESPGLSKISEVAQTKSGDSGVIYMATKGDGTGTTLNIDTLIYSGHPLYITLGTKGIVQVTNAEAALGTLKVYEQAEITVTGWGGDFPHLNDATFIGQGITVRTQTSTLGNEFDPLNLLVENASGVTIYTTVRPQFGYFNGKNYAAVWNLEENPNYTGQIEYRSGEYDLLGTLAVGEGGTLDLRCAYAEAYASVKGRVKSEGEQPYDGSVTGVTFQEEFAHLTMSEQGKITVLEGGVLLASSVTDTSKLTSDGSNLLTTRMLDSAYYTETYDDESKVYRYTIVDKNGNAIDPNTTEKYTVNGTVEIRDTAGDGKTATITAAGDMAITDAEGDMAKHYTTRNYGFTVENADINVTDASSDIEEYTDANKNTTISNILIGDSVTNDKQSSHGTVTLDNAGNQDFNVIYAKDGDIAITNRKTVKDKVAVLDEEGYPALDEEGNAITQLVDTLENVNAKTVHIGAGKTVSVSGTLGDALEKATLNVTSLLQADGYKGEDEEKPDYSKIDADLRLGAGATLNVAAADGIGGIDMLGNEVVFDIEYQHTALTLSTDDYTQAWAMEKGGKYDLFHNVSAFTMYSGAFPVDYPITEEMAVTYDASDFFSNLEKGCFYLCYSGAGEAGGNGGNVGTIYLYSMVPEPTTGTLSLLALAGLAARRRRK